MVKSGKVKIFSTAKEVLQYCQRSTAVLSVEYSSTSTEVLEPREIVAVLITECLAWNCFILVYPFSR